MKTTNKLVSSMNLLLRLEYLSGLLLGVFLFAGLHDHWWYPVLFFFPIIGMVGHIPIMALAGTIMLGHIYFDRILGYELKYPDKFDHTHLSSIGISNPPKP